MAELHGAKGTEGFYRELSIFSMEFIIFSVNSFHLIVT